MTEHKYYECDICGTTAKRIGGSSSQHAARDIANFLLENRKVRHVCSECTNDLLTEIRRVIKGRVDMNKGEE